jgi:hypothetical protein
MTIDLGDVRRPEELVGRCGGEGVERVGRGRGGGLGSIFGLDKVPAALKHVGVDSGDVYTSQAELIQLQQPISPLMQVTHQCTPEDP